MKQACPKCGTEMRKARGRHEKPMKGFETGPIRGSFVWHDEPHQGPLLVNCGGTRQYWICQTCHHDWYATVKP